MRSKSSRATFLAYRAGEITFDEVARRLAPRIDSISAYFVGRWRCRLHGVADVRQEIMIAMWRALDTWDPNRGASIEVHVHIAVGRHVSGVLAKAAGWPRRDRRAVRASMVALKPEHMDMMSESPGQEAIVSMLRLLRKQDPEFLAAARCVAATGEILGGMHLRAVEISKTSDDIEENESRLVRWYRIAARELREDNVEPRW